MLKEIFFKTNKTLHIETNIIYNTQDSPVCTISVPGLGSLWILDFEVFGGSPTQYFLHFRKKNHNNILLFLFILIVHIRTLSFHTCCFGHFTKHFDIHILTVRENLWDPITEVTLSLAKLSEFLWKTRIKQLDYSINAIRV